MNRIESWQYRFLRIGRKELDVLTRLVVDQDNDDDDLPIVPSRDEDVLLEGKVLRNLVPVNRDLRVQQDVDEQPHVDDDRGLSLAEKR